MSASCSSSTSSTCHCVNFCYCGLGEEYGEGEGSYGSSTRISWQHFPPSTSSRSRCDDSSTDQQRDRSLPESSCKMEEEAEGEIPCSTVSSTKYPIMKSVSQMKAEHYLRIRHIYEFYNFLIGHLICAEPEDPLEYLSEILDRCISFRDCYGEEPLLVSRVHLKCLYDSFDPYGKGTVTMDQYEIAMENIGISRGITPNNPNPPVDRQGNVSEEYFINEGMRCLCENLRKMLRIPKDWEENRLVWKTVMMRRYVRRQKMQIPVCPCSPEEQSREEESSGTPTACKCGIVKEVPCPAVACPCPPKMRHEPEQMFLNG